MTTDTIWGLLGKIIVENTPYLSITAPILEEDGFQLETGPSLHQRLWIAVCYSILCAEAEVRRLVSLSLSLCLSLSVSVSVSVSVSLSVSLSIYLSIYLSMYIFIHIYIYIYLSLSLSLSLSLVTTSLSLHATLQLL